MDDAVAGKITGHAGKRSRYKQVEEGKYAKRTGNKKNCAQTQMKKEKGSKYSQCMNNITLLHAFQCPF